MTLTPKELIPKELILKIFDMVTRKGEWESRLKMLLSFPYLWEYSKTKTHMKIILGKWHGGTCYGFEARVSRTMPTTLDRDWLNKMLKAARTNEDGSEVKEDFIYFPNYVHWSKCRYCGNLCIGQCSVL